MTETAASLPAGPVQRTLDRLADAAIAVAATALIGLVVVQGWQVFTRYVLNSSSVTGSVQLGESLST